MADELAVILGTFLVDDEPPHSLPQLTRLVARLFTGLVGDYYQPEITIECPSLGLKTLPREDELVWTIALTSMSSPIISSGEPASLLEAIVALYNRLTATQQSASAAQPLKEKHA